jgi:hypothetical protein
MFTRSGAAAPKHPKLTYHNGNPPMDAHHGRQARREQIELELKANPNRSDREIARKVGVDNKTVGAVRAQQTPPIPQSAPKSDAEEDDNSSMRKFNFWDEPGDIVATIQMPIKARINPDTGYLVISQAGDMYDDDQKIEISPEFIATFMESLAAIVKAR